jgi:hypothetical protein
VLLDTSKLLVKARSHGMCEGCGTFGLLLDVHHRQARGMGGVAGEEATVANSADNLLALCRSCHAETEHAETWDLTEQLGWRIPKWVPDPGAVPALIHTVNGYAWWLLMKDGGYTWMDLSADHRLSWGQP